MKCERCPATTPDLFDYCAICSKNVCPDCMEKGCCGVVPAISGERDDNEEGQASLNEHGDKE